MKRSVVILMLVLCLSGCASVKEFFFGQPTWKEVETPDGEIIRVDKEQTAQKTAKIKVALTVDKRQAIDTARAYAARQGFDQEFDLERPSKVRRYLTADTTPEWRWEVYFDSKDESFWKMWGRSPMMILVNGSTGEAISWGRR